MKKITRNFLLPGMLFLLCIFPLWAQQQVSGVVTDAETGETLPGVNVLVTGSNTGTTTDIDGLYALSVPANASLQFSFVGFISQTVAVGNQSTINVVLQPDSQNLDEVVVTAMGVKKERKSLGYAFQEIKSGDLVEARENNIADVLVGNSTRSRV